MKKSSKNSINGLEPLVTLTMADRVEDQLRKFLKEGGFKPGDPIPKEMEIAENLGVSRNVVREALSRFRMLGLIETKKRRGMVLARPDVLVSLEKVLDPYILSKDTRQELFELRLILEMGLADVLFKRKKEEDFEVLQEIADREKLAVKTLDRVQCDIEFHAMLYRIAGNNILKRFQKLLLPVFQYVVEYESKHRESKWPLVGEVKHQDLIHVLRKGTPDEFRVSMYSHLKPHFDHV
ncbi:MAG: GntR family transcriptional regulator [Cyclobacteriaceae bacterium]